MSGLQEFVYDSPTAVEPEPDTGTDDVVEDPADGADEPAPAAVEGAVAPPSVIVGGTFALPKRRGRPPKQR